MRLARLLFLLVAALAPALVLGRPAGPQPAPSGAETAAFEAAVAEYEAGRPAQAEARFRELLESGWEHPDVLFNMGNCAYRRGRWPVAVAAYEWALLLDPGDTDARHNLLLARSHLVVDRIGDGPSPAADAVIVLLRRIPDRVTLLAALAAWTLAWVLLAWRTLRASAGWAVGASVLFFVVGFALGAHAGFRELDRRGGERAILLRPEVQVTSGPGSDYAALFTLHAGTLVRVREERAGWLRVHLPRGPSGWIDSRAATILGRPRTLPGVETRIEGE